MELRIEAEGDVVERQELLNGTQLLTLEGRSADVRWSVSGDVSWNRGLVEFAGEGDITLARDDGASIFATVVRADAEETEETGERLRIEYEIDGGEAEFESARGRISAAAVIAGAAFRGVWTVRLTES